MTPKALTDLAAFEAMIDRKVVEAGERLAEAGASASRRLGMTRDEAIAALAECYRLTGADPDGDEDWRLARYAVEEVRRMRAEKDALEDQVEARRVACEHPTRLCYTRVSYRKVGHSEIEYVSRIHGRVPPGIQHNKPRPSKSGDWVYTSEGWRRPTPTEAHRVACGEEPW